MKKLKLKELFEESEKLDDRALLTVVGGNSEHSEHSDDGPSDRNDTGPSEVFDVGASEFYDDGPSVRFDTGM